MPGDRPGNLIGHPAQRMTPVAQGSMTGREAEGRLRKLAGARAGLCDPQRDGQRPVVDGTGDLPAAGGWEP